MIRAEGISKQFIRQGRGTNIFMAVQEMDFSLPSGKLTMLSGRSGSGKSTLLNMLAGLLAPSKGKVFFGETDLYAMPDEELSCFRNQNFGCIPQGQTAISSLTVWENVLLPYTLYREEAPDEYAEELLELLDIAELRNVMPSHLSGGEMRRMAIARALVRRPKVLFADEPTGDLDDENTRTVLSVLKQKAEGGMAVLLVTHEVEAEGFADRIYRMSGGVLEASQEK